MIENYPLAVGGVDDYPVKVGSMLLTIWVVLRPESGLVYRRFPDLPPRPGWMDH